MGYQGTLSRIEFSYGRAVGFWLVVSALLLIAVLVPPLLLPLLFLLPSDPMVAAVRREWAVANAPASRDASRPRAPRGPPQI